MDQATKDRLKRAAEKVKAEREEEERKDAEAYERMTSGPMWTAFKILTYWCILFALLTTVDVYVDGPTEDLAHSEIEINRGRLGAYGVQSVWVGNDLFTPTIEQWIDFDENSFKIVRSFIFRDTKYFSFEQGIFGSDDTVRHYCVKRISIYTFTPYMQIVLLLPLLVLIFRKPKPWFKFARLGCFLLIFPGSLFILITLLV